MITQQIQINPNHRGSISRANEKSFLDILISVARCYTGEMFDRTLDPIELRMHGGPIMYPKERGLPYFMILPAEDENDIAKHVWHFLQEVGHIYSNYENTNVNGDNISRHCWLDECLMTVAAFVILDKLSEIPPLELQGREVELKARYSLEVDGLTQTTENLTDFSCSNRGAMRNDAHFLDKHSCIQELIDLFKRNSNCIAALAFLNLDYEIDESAETKARKWYKSSPFSLRPTVASILDKLSLCYDDESLDYACE